jgi:hypothetical protein
VSPQSQTLVVGTQHATAVATGSTTIIAALGIIGTTTLAVQ